VIIVASLLIMSSFIGWAGACAGFVVAIGLGLPLQKRIGREVGRLRRTAIKETDQRIATMNEILQVRRHRHGFLHELCKVRVGRSCDKACRRALNTQYYARCI
jgi:hypothetical protein